MTTQAALDGTALLAAIIAEPGDDTHRLVYADWLEENGQAERAEFVRDQMASYLHSSVHIIPAGIGSRGPMAIGFDDGLAALGVGRTYMRGFVESVSLPLQAWLDHGPQLVRAHPIAAVRLTDKEPGAGSGIITLGGGDTQMFIWWHPDRSHQTEEGGEAATLPLPLYERLPGVKMPTRGTCYRSRQKAIDALSIAALKHARGDA